MHELPITRSILQIALEHAARARATKIIAINLIIGDYASLVDESITFYWKIIAAGTIAETAQLHFERMPAVLFCIDCQQQFTPEYGELLCPNCQSAKVKVISGDQFQVDSIEVE